jgi:GTP-binding protein
MRTLFINSVVIQRKVAHSARRRHVQVALTLQQSKRYKTTNHHKQNTDSSSTILPPLVIYPTASSFVYVSSAAIDCHNNDADHHGDDGDSLLNNGTDTTDATNTAAGSSTYQKGALVHAPLHPKSLFTQSNKIPPSFEKSHFRYISPTEFNYELPNLPIPEVAFLGRSNVGKSSLLNALTTKNLAKTSKTPGRTQQVNYFGLYPHHKQSSSTKSSSPSLDQALGCIIDLPGYGYAHAPDEIVTKWQEKTQEFLQQRISLGNLQRVYILLDARRGLTPFDSSIMGWLDEAECEYTAVLTKSDAVKRATIVKLANEICMRYHVQRLAEGGDDSLGGCQSPFVHVTSSKKYQGIVDLMWAIDADFLNGCDVLRQLQLYRMQSGNF